MSFHNTAPCFLTFYSSDQSLLPFEIKNFTVFICIDTWVFISYK